MIVVVIPAALGVVYVGGWALAIAIAAFGVLGASEFYRLAEHKGIQPLKAVGFAGAALPALAVFAVSADGLDLEGAWFAFGLSVWIIAVLMVAMRRRGPDQNPLASVAITVFGALYAGGMIAFVILIRHPHAPYTSWGATWLVFLPLAVVWICDSLAMGCGSLIGGPKLAPVLSPNKTWAGAIGGSIGGAFLVAPLYGHFILERVGIQLSLWQLVTLGLVVSGLGQVGDVAESLFKREAGVKDSGGFFPGHGGVLDRFDSMYWALPVAAIMLNLYGTI